MKTTSNIESFLQSKMEQATPITHPLPSVQSSPPTILLVDDFEIVRQAASRILSKGGYKVLTKATGNEALSHLEMHREPIELALVDLRMTDFDGIELTKRMRESHPETKFIIMSGNLEEQELEMMKRSDISGFIRKPFLSSDLINLIESILAPGSTKTQLTSVSQWMARSEPAIPFFIQHAAAAHLDHARPSLSGGRF